MIQDQMKQPRKANEGVCVCVCVREREREREGKRGREREREKKGEIGIDTGTKSYRKMKIDTK